MNEAEIAHLQDDLRRAIHGPAWHGPSLEDVLSGCTAEEATGKSIPGAHSIREIVLHLTAWTQEVSRRLAGGTGYELEEGDWPPVPSGSAEGWKEVLLDLEAAQVQLLKALDRFPPDRLDDVVASPREREAGITFRTMLDGLVQHHAYHAGQIALMLKYPRRARA
jgi:uncharacterized damage-inducible protein DinB